MIKHKKWISRIYRSKNVQISRHKKLSLDKNERVSKFERNFFKKIHSKISSENFTKYPEVYNLYKALSKFHKLKINQFVVTTGIDGAIKSCFDLFVSKGNRVIVLEPTFAMLDVYCKIAGAKKINIKYDKKLNLNINYLLKSINQKISLIVIANPNSPTGTLISESNIKKIIIKANIFNIPILVDEAYYGFTSNTVFPLVKKYKNLIVGRTFSKAYGIAGLRVGYIISNVKLAKLFFNVKSMYEINSIGILASIILIKNSNIHKKYIIETNKGLNLLIKYLKNNNVLYIKTHANFIYINIKKINYFYKKLLKIGILTKKGMGVRGYENYLRVTLGPPKEMKKIISKLKIHKK
jgi:histidinol-phosphate aminotransferase